MKKFVLLLAALCVTACTTIPSRYSVDESLSTNGGYIVEGEDETGIYLDVFYKSYSFAPRQDDDIQEAIKYFKNIASKLAFDRSRTIKPMFRSQLKIDSTRNIIDSHYSIYISGKATYE